MKISGYIEYLKTDIWRLRVKDLPTGKALVITLLRVIVLTFRGVSQDKWQLKASSLTYYTVMSIVPALAMGFGISKGFGFETALESVLVKWFPGQEEVVGYIADFARRLLENVKGGVMAGISFLVLFWAVFRLLSQIETSFNDIWGIKHSRSIGRKITDYLTIMLVSPFFIITSSALAVFISSSMQDMVQNYSMLGAVSPLIFFLLKFLPFLVVWILFTFLYVFMPNTKINWQSSLLAAVIAGTVFQIFQGIYIYFQVKISNYNAVYGSFAALPLFFLWLQTSWLIVMFGAEVSSAHQNVENFEFSPDAGRVSHSFNRIMFLKIMHILVKHFAAGAKTSPVGLSHELEVPVPLINRYLNDLVEANLVSEITVGRDASSLFQPAVDPDKLTIAYIIEALDKKGGRLPYAHSESNEIIEKNLAEFEEALRNHPANLRLKDIA